MPVFYDISAETVLQTSGPLQSQSVATGEHQLVDTASAATDNDRPTEQLAVRADTNVLKLKLQADTWRSVLNTSEEVTTAKLGCGSMLILQSSSKNRQVWGVISSALIQYVAAALPHS